MKRSKIMKGRTALDDDRPRFGDFEDYMNRMMNYGPCGIVRCGEAFDNIVRGEFWCIYFDIRCRHCPKGK
jgi:hypothetical protein